MESLFLYAFLLNPALLYTLAVVGLVFEANTLLFTIGFLTAQGLFAKSIIIPLAFSASVLGNVWWYVFGRLWGNHWNPYSTVMTKLASPFDEQIQNKTFYAMALTKFVYALNCAAIIRAGALRIPFRRFLVADIATSVIWMATVWPLGYFSGSILSVTALHLRYVELALLLALLVFLFGKHFLAVVLKRKLEGTHKAKIMETTKTVPTSEDSNNYPRTD